MKLVCHGATLETLRQAIPAARALPLLQALAGVTAQTLWLEAQPGLALQVMVAAA